MCECDVIRCPMCEGRYDPSIGCLHCKERERQVEARQKPAVSDKAVKVIDGDKLDKYLEEQCWFEPHPNDPHEQGDAHVNYALLLKEIESGRLDAPAAAEGLLPPDEARKALLGIFKPEYHDYINRLAGDFAGVLCRLLNTRAPAGGGG